MGHHRWVLKFVRDDEREGERSWKVGDSDGPLGTTKNETIKLEFSNIIWVLVNLKVKS